jgi:hypothetical protein
MTILRYAFQIVLGLIFGLLCFGALTPLLASLPSSSSAAAGFAVILIVLLVVAFSSNLRRSFGRSFLLLGVCVFLLPLSMMALSGTVLNESVTVANEANKSATVAGGVIAGGLMTMLAGFVGFVLGSVLLLIGLILSLGGRREVVVVNKFR